MWLLSGRESNRRAPLHSDFTHLIRKEENLLLYAQLRWDT